MNTTLSIVDDVPLTLAGKIIYSIIAALGIAGNSLVIYVLACRVRSRKGNTNILLINQSLIDVTTSVLLVLCYLVPGQHKSHPSTPASRVFICYFWNSKYLFWATILASTLNLLWLTFERYYATLHPLKYRSQPWLTWPRSVLLATLPWIVSYLLESYTVARHYLDKHDRCKLWKFQTQSGKILYSVAMLISNYIVPVGLMLFAYVRIYKALRVNAGTVITPNERTPIVRPANGQGEACRRNVIKTLFTVCGVFSLLWLPNQFSYFYFNINDNINFDESLYNVSICIAFLNMCINPFIYAFQYNQFREGLRTAVPCLTRWRHMRNANNQEAG